MIVTAVIVMTMPPMNMSTKGWEGLDDLNSLAQRGTFFISGSFVRIKILGQTAHGGHCQLGTGCSYDHASEMASAVHLWDCIANGL
mmetsp:Transcript_43757/g.74705  ORF Transcript_43757/g.74705 Transcript_43757/m.74705 type:complete len:86 (+) Transcript_43757:1177-1434(+)